MTTTLLLSLAALLAARDAERTSRLTALREIGGNLKAAIVRADVDGILRYCHGFEVDLGVDNYVSCRDLAKIMRMKSDYRRCRYFDTACYRAMRGEGAVSVKDALSKAGDAVTISTRFFRPDGRTEDLDHALIVFEAPGLSEAVGMTYWKGTWVLSEFLPDI